jgi:hypothetical protein
MRYRVTWTDDDGEEHSAIVESEHVASLVALTGEAEVEAVAEDAAEVATALFGDRAARRSRGFRPYALVGVPHPSISAHGFSEDLIEFHSEQHECEPDDTEPGPLWRRCPCG